MGDKRQREIERETKRERERQTERGETQGEGGRQETEIVRQRGTRDRGR